MTDGKIYTDEEMDPSAALKYITDSWVEDGQYCDQTVIDLRDYALSLEAENAELKRRLKEAESLLRESLDAVHPRPATRRKIEQALKEEP